MTASHLASRAWGDPPQARPGAQDQEPQPGQATAWAAEAGKARLFGPDVCAMAGPPGRPLKLPTLARYKSTAAAHRATGTATGRDLPEPDGHEPAPGGGVPLAWWYPATLDPWMAARHPAGRPPQGGGRPAVIIPPEHRATTGPKRRAPEAIGDPPPVTGENHDEPDPGQAPG